MQGGSENAGGSATAREVSRCRITATQHVVALESCLDGAAREAAMLLDAALAAYVTGESTRHRYAPDATVVSGRTASPGRHDLELTPGAADVRGRRRSVSSPDVSSAGGFTAIEVELSQDRAGGLVALVSGQREDYFANLEEVDVVGVQARLMRRGGRWVIARLRTWPEAWMDATGGRLAAGDEHFRELDREVDRVRANFSASQARDDRRAWVEALLRAGRFAEASEALRPLLRHSPSEWERHLAWEIATARGEPEPPPD